MVDIENATVLVKAVGHQRSFQTNSNGDSRISSQQTQTKKSSSQ